MKAFNSRDGAEWTKTLNYPHVRIAGGGQVAVWNSAEAYRSSNDSGWKRSAWDWWRLVQKSSDKLRFLVEFTRYDEADKKMASSEARYILTLKDARWGGAGTVKLPGYNREGLRFLSPLEGMTARSHLAKPRWKPSPFSAVIFLKAEDRPMDAKIETLTPAADLARDNPVRIPNESGKYRAARTALLAQEIELRRHIERVAAQRRALPAGGEVTGDYRFRGEDGATDFARLFGDRQTLAVYSYMFGPQRERPCPMCTNLLGAWEGNAADIGQRVSLVVVARSPIERLIAWKRERGWKNLRLYTDLNGAYSRDYFGLLPDGSEIPAFNVFTRRDGTVRHFWSGEMTGATADPGQDPRGAPDPAPLWMVLDATPEGRGGDWYPKLDYDA